jgi:hypothetical protein
MKIKPDKSAKHHQASRHCVNEELEGYPYPVFPSPKGSYEIGGNKSKLPENIKYDSVTGGENSNKGSLKNEHRPEEDIQSS